MLTIAKTTEASGFTDDDLQRVRFVLKLRATGMPIRDVRRHKIDLYGKGTLECAS